MIDRQESFAEALRRLMKARGLSMRALEAEVPMSRAKLYRLLEPRTSVADEDATILDTTLQSGITLATAARRDREAAVARVLLGPNGYTDAAVRLGSGVAGQGVDDVNRREFLRAGAGMATLLLELGRLGLDEALGSRTDLSGSEWHAIVEEHGYGYMTTPPHELLTQLMVDVIAIQYAVGGEPEDSLRAKDLQRCGALLAALTAMTVANLGDLREGKRWWRTARELADRSTDPTARAWVRGREIVRGMYEERPIGMILNLADRYEDELSGAPQDAMLEFLGGKAQALALAGRSNEAGAVLPKFMAVCAGVPAERTAHAGSIFGWSPDREWFTRSFVHSFGGNFAEAAAAQDAAVAAYAPEYVRGPAQIQMMRAVCLARMGDSASAASHALEQLSRLPAADHIRPIVDLAHRVDRFIPHSDARLPEVMTYRDFLATSRQIEASA